MCRRFETTSGTLLVIGQCLLFLVACHVLSSLFRYWITNPELSGMQVISDFWKAVTWG